MNQFFKINEYGLIIGADNFLDGDDIPNDYKEAWSPNVVLREPYWNFSKNDWDENISDLKFLEESKLAKNDELSRICQEQIVSGFNCEISGISYHLSYDKEAQSNLAERFQLFQNDMITEIKITAHKGDEIARVICDKKLFNSIYIASVQHKENCISKYRDELLPLVEQSITVEQVESITWETVVVEPKPSLVLVEEDNTLDKQVDEMKISQAEGDMGILSLLSMMGVIG